MTQRSTLFAIALFAFSAPLASANSAIEPRPRDERWTARHEGFVEIARKGDVDVLFLGDSITDGWRNDSPSGGKEIWEKRYAPLKAANFGISGDRTQHLLWRLQNGELHGIQPKVFVLMIGTNNTGFESDKTTPRNTTAETVEGVKSVVSLLRREVPSAKILLLAIFPRAESPEHPQRKQVNEINAEIAKLHDGRNVHFLDIGGKFLSDDGTLLRELVPDFLHPNAQGYQVWADAIEEPLQALLQSNLPN